MIGRKLMGLEDAISMSVVDPIRDDAGWRFTGGDYDGPDQRLRLPRRGLRRHRPGFRRARTASRCCGTSSEGRIVNNESADILRMLSTVFAPLAEHPVELVRPTR